MNHPESLAQVKNLKGKTLGCWCKKYREDKACHGDILVELAKCV